MGGMVRVILVEKDKTESFVAWTNSICPALKEKKFIDGDLSDIHEHLEYFKKLQQDYQENKETGKYVNMQASYYGAIGAEFEPVEYGLIYIDTLNKKILYLQDYSNLQTINNNFILYNNGSVRFTDLEIDQSFKDNLFSKVMFYAENEVISFEIDESISTYIDLIKEVKSKTKDIQMDYSEFFGNGTMINLRLTLKHSYHITKYENFTSLADALINEGLNLSEKNIIEFKNKDKLEE